MQATTRNIDIIYLVQTHFSYYSIHAINVMLAGKVAGAGVVVYA